MFYVYNNILMEGDNNFYRYIDSVYPSRSALETLLAKKEKIQIYFGIDPTSPFIHLGHSIPLQLLNEFQEMGHQIILVFGDFTGMIGDPSGKDIHRTVLTNSQLNKNSLTYKSQVEKILDFSKNPPLITYNSKWWDKINTKKFLEIARGFTLSQLIERDLFQDRLKRGRPISLSEFLYPLLQGYDSVALNIDIEVGGTDQLFNMLIGREMMKRYQKKEKIVITTPLLEGADGRKMSKSLGNIIEIENDPSNMYGKIMSIQDPLIVNYLTLTTKVSIEEIKKIKSAIDKGSLNPILAKKKLAYDLVSKYHEENIAKSAAKEFERVFQQKGTPKTVNYHLKQSKATIINVLYDSNLASSKSDAKRLIDQGGVEVNGHKLSSKEVEVELESGSIIRAGKFKAIKLIIEGK